MTTQIRTSDWQSFTATAPTGGYTGGTMVAINNVVGVVYEDTDATEDAVIIYECAKITVPSATVGAGGWTAGTKVYFDSTNAEVTTTASGNTLCGIVSEDADAGDTEVEIHLMGALGIVS